MATKAAAIAPVASVTTVAGKVRVTPELATVRTDIAIPQRKRGGISSHYNFESLSEVGASFGIKNKTAAQINAIVSKENRRHVTETVDPTNPSKKVKSYSKKYSVFDVDPNTDPDNAKCRVFRTI